MCVGAPDNLHWLKSKLKGRFEKKTNGRPARRKGRSKRGEDTQQGNKGDGRRVGV